MRVGSWAHEGLRTRTSGHAWHTPWHAAWHPWHAARHGLAAHSQLLQFERKLEEKLFGVSVPMRPKLLLVNLSAGYLSMYMRVTKGVANQK